MLQAVLKVFFLLLVLYLCKHLFRHRVQIGSHRKVDNLHVKYYGGPLLLEVVAAYAYL